ncbi:Protein transport protein S9 plasma membrane t-SNARE [Agyrium rufum]|nr:Protein transport protein S9 plasma membrane t-SNARE [Agyrium rufum]
MGKFSFNKKDEGSEDANRLGLFGSRSKSKSPAPSANPYAQAPPTSNNPYAQQALSNGNPYAQQGSRADPYLAAKANAYAPPQPQSNPVYKAEKAGGVSNDRYGASNGNYGGYGASRYGDTEGGASGPTGPKKSQYGAGGYGGFGGAGAFDSQTEEKRSELFGAAKDRVATKTMPRASERRQDIQPGYGGPPPAYTDSKLPRENDDDEFNTGADPGYGGNAGSYGGGYGGKTYEDRQMTAEEEEEEDVSATKQQIRGMKQEDVSSTRNALRVAQMAEESGMDTLARLGQQGEYIHSTEKNLDLAHNQNRIAEERARELKTLNRSMFAVHVANPFTSKSRQTARDQDVIDRHLEERDQREATRRAEYTTNQRMQQNFQKIDGKSKVPAPSREKNLAERSKYQFEADSEDEGMEDEIDSNLDALGGATGRLHQLALATNRELEIQNSRLDVVGEKTDRVDLGIASNSAKINRIK